MKLDLVKLRKLASAAPQPGPWKRLKDDSAEYRIVDANGFWVAAVGRDPKDAAFIAACSPDVMLALLDELDRLRPVYAAGKFWFTTPDLKTNTATWDLAESVRVAIAKEQP